jgi:hypothetical protein
MQPGKDPFIPCSLPWRAPFLCCASVPRQLNGPSCSTRIKGRSLTPSEEGTGESKYDELEIREWAEAERDLETKDPKQGNSQQAVKGLDRESAQTCKESTQGRWAARQRISRWDAPDQERAHHAPQPRVRQQAAPSQREQYPQNHLRDRTRLTLLQVRTEMPADKARRQAVRAERTGKRRTIPT